MYRWWARDRNGDRAGLVRCSFGVVSEALQHAVFETSGFNIDRFLSFLNWLVLDKEIEIRPWALQDIKKAPQWYWGALKSN